MKQKIMVRLKRNDSCPFCGNDRCIDIYDTRDKSINYTYLLDMLEKNPNFKADYSNSDLSYARCKTCGKIFMIDWTRSKTIPCPLIVDCRKDIMLDRCFNQI